MNEPLVQHGGTLPLHFILVRRRVPIGADGHGLRFREEDDALVMVAWWRNVAEPPNLMPHRSTCIPLNTKYSREDTKLRSSVEHTPWENTKIKCRKIGVMHRGLPG